jgi:hypothetical protein
MICRIHGGNIMSNSIMPTPKDVAAMKRLQQIMNGNLNAKEELVAEFIPGSGTKKVLNETFVPIRGPTEKDIQSMKDVLEKLNRVTNENVRHLVEEAQHDPELNEALVTKSTARGAQIGIYEIRVRIQETASGKEKKWYNVVDNNTGTKIAEDLSVYEAAYGIVKYLNKGYSPLSKEIREVLSLEEKYNQYRTDAIRFKRRAVESLKKGDGESGAIFESRYDDHKYKALSVHNKLKNIVKIIR